MYSYLFNLRVIYFFIVIAVIAGFVSTFFTASVNWVTVCCIGLFFWLLYKAQNTRIKGEGEIISQALESSGYQNVSIELEKHAANWFFGSNGYSVCYADLQGQSSQTHCTYDPVEQRIYWSESPKNLYKQIDESVPSPKASVEPPISSKELLLNQLISPHKGERLAAIATLAEQSHPSQAVLQRLETTAVADPNPAVRQAARDLLARKRSA